MEALCILKNRCLYFISLDSGLLSLFYYLDVEFPIKLITLWGSKDVGILKQDVRSPNNKMIHVPLLYEKNLSSLTPEKLLENIYPKDIENLLEQNNQRDLLKKFQEFSIEEKKKLTAEILSIDRTVLERQKLFFERKVKKDNFIPLKKAYKATFSDYKKGINILTAKKAAAIIMAAGQGSRLGFLGPKALFKIKNKTLIEYQMEKIAAKQKKYNVKFYLSVMTSHLNHEEIVNYFDKNLYFGLEKDQIDFFIQKKAPFLDEKGRWILQDGKILLGPDGNGSIFESFSESDILTKYLKNKIKYISIVPVDNPLADPFDEKLFGFHKSKKNEVTIKCIVRETADEKKGAIVLKDNKIKVIEYIDIEKDKKYYFSNSGIYVLNTDFFKKVRGLDLNYNFVWKRISNESEIFAYKSESFIFDGFDNAKRVNTLVDEKENFYASLKEKSNLYDIEKSLN
ncbi:MAG: hypothetical protein ACD_20C00273G0002 [uncultured bacterium]|nr:MAG: hypothetical protein ACD_20C00273G0002 [uncultured bacterium]